jgi:hypothetical protein
LSCSLSGLPDGLFSNQESQFGKILEDLARENLGIFYDHLIYVFYGHWKYFMAIWYICGHLVYFSPFGYIFWKNLATLLAI